MLRTGRDHYGGQAAVAQVRAVSAIDEVSAILGQAETLDGPAFEAVYRYYEHQLTHFAYRQNSRDPEGVAHAALFDAYRAFNRNPIRNERQFRAYLYRAAKNHTIGEHRKQVPLVAVIQDEAMSEDDGADARATQSWLNDLVEELPSEQRRVITGRFVDDMTAEEIGQELGKTPNAVHQLQHRAVKSLRRFALASVFVALVLLAAFGWYRLTSEDSFLLNAPATPQIDSDPVQGVNSTTMVPESSAALQTDAVEPGQAQTAPAATDAAPPTSEPLPASDQPATSLPPTTSDSPAAPEPPATSAPATTVAPAPTTTLPATTVTEPATPPQDEVIRPSIAVTGCQRTELGSGMTAILFYEAAAAAETDFSPPEAVRFLSSSAQVLADIDVSLRSVSGLTHQAHGWIALDGAATTVSRQAPSPSQTDGWGVIYDETTTANQWVSVEYLSLTADGTMTWIPVPSCAR